ncbi:DUF4112 domain-containing protein [Sandaracinus amylolyticus]|uniref:DUF4112 domain-containing protein n=1 Tax=Sandaracinus amylolyticus TaxID=927083 RepID=A0A0F6YKN5_9BACT|nr:DUF4112 domain-containing protein [Sandaracinus amylolyticus]AKF08338.1 Hypothetical protein DB32_005487 [Sandaracinus amylolyticus]
MERHLDEHAKRITDRAVDEALARIDGGDQLSPELRKLATQQLAPWAEKLVRFLDETLRIPGTNIHLGLDPVIGFLIPGAGDAITSTGSVSLLLLALKERVPTIALLRMLLNIAIDTVVGAIPFLGDAFDMFFRSNRRNLEIIRKYRDDPKAKPGAADYLVVGAGVLLAIAGFVIPVVIVYGVGFGVLYELWRTITGS